MSMFRKKRVAGACFYWLRVKQLHLHAYRSDICSGYRSCRPCFPSQKMYARLLECEVSTTISLFQTDNELYVSANADMQQKANKRNHSKIDGSGFWNIA